MLRKSVLVFSVISFILSFLFMSCNEQKLIADKDLVLLMAESNPPDSIAGRVDTAFKNKIEELSFGHIKVDLKYSGVLGDEKQVMELIMKPNSLIHLARVTASLSSFGGEKSKLITIPYTFKNEEHFWKFAKSDLAKEILNEAYEKNLGVKGLFYGEEGFRHFFSVSPIHSVKDIENKKVRISKSEDMMKLVRCFKAVPVQVSFSDLYSVLQREIVDVAEQPVSNYLSNHFYEPAKYMILDGHMLGAFQILINSKIWDSLSDSQKKIIMAASDYASEYCRFIASESEKDVLSQLSDAGVKFTVVKDKTPWQDACKDLIEESSSQYPELYKKILDLGK